METTTIENTKTENKARRSFYKWHRIIGLTALVPVICWTLSGLSHPFMSNWFRPYIAQEVYKSPLQSKLHPVLSIQQILDQNHITMIRNFSLVNFNNSTYYQVLESDSTYNYYSAADAKLLQNGDHNYAIFLARFFTLDSLSKIKDVHLQTTFDGQYQPINHLLPVWKVSFDRPDGMDVYIETGQSRMGTFNNNTRKTFLWVFEQLHTWDFLAAIGGDQFRNVVLLVIVGIMFLSMLSGLTVYGFFWNRFKTIQQKRKAEGKADKRFIHRYHRQLGLIVSFVMLLFLVSGAFHLLVKLHNTDPAKKDYAQLINRKDLTVSNLQLALPDSNIQKIAIANFNGKTYYQVSSSKKQLLYFGTMNGQELSDGDIVYAKFLSNYYRPQASSAKSTGEPVKTTRIKQYDNEYGFINKRLPVVKVSYPGNENWYIETTSAKLAAKVAGIDRAEGLSFIFLHKFFWMTWAGKDIRDIISMLAALSVLSVSLLGLTAFIKNK
jgi:hypothetical protein